MQVPLTTVFMWIKNAGRIVDQMVKERKQPSQDIEILEMDELYTFIKKAETQQRHRRIQSSIHQNLDCCGSGQI